VFFVFSGNPEKPLIPVVPRVDPLKGPLFRDSGKTRFSGISGKSRFPYKKCHFFRRFSRFLADWSILAHFREIRVIFGLVQTDQGLGLGHHLPDICWLVLAVGS